MSDKKKKFELELVDISDIKYDKPKKTNSLVPDKEYEKIDNACSENVKASNTGVTYVSTEAFPKLLKCKKKEVLLIYDKIFRKEDKKTISDEDFVNSSAMVGHLDKLSQEVRCAERQAIHKYGRDTLINIGDSPELEVKRRQFDSHSKKVLPNLGKIKKRNEGIVSDDVTGEPLEENFHFHHKNNKAIFTTPEDTVDPDKGSLLNPSTHRGEIHGNNIIDEIGYEEYKKSRKKEKA